MKKVLITGGAGFIGSHLSEMYLENGYRVLVVDNLVSGKLDNLTKCFDNENFQFKKCDITNKQAIREIIENYVPDIINHHAAQKSVADSVENPLNDLDTNLKGLLNILSCLKEIKSVNFIFSSSGGALSKEIVGDDCSSETDYPSLESPYAITKFASEQYIKLYSKQYGFNYTILRYANVFGPRQDAQGECGVVPIFISQVNDGLMSKIMTYSDMPDGCTRDYVYVSDVVEANRLASVFKTNEVYNVSSGKELSMHEIYKKVVDVFEGEYKLYFTGPRAGDIKRSVLNNSKITKKLGWNCKVTFEEGLELMKKGRNYAD